MNKKWTGLLVVLALVSQSAFAQFEEHMKSRLKTVISQARNHQISDDELLSEFLILYPELDNEKDRSDIKELITEFKDVLAKARAAATTDLNLIDGNWKFVNENAVFSIHGDSGTMSTSYGGCTEVTPLTLVYTTSSEFVLAPSGPMTSSPFGCTGGSAPFPPAATLSFVREGNFLTLAWNANWGTAEFYALLYDQEFATSTVASQPSPIPTPSAPTTAVFRYGGLQLESSSAPTNDSHVTFTFMGQTFTGPRGAVHDLGNGDRVVASPWNY